MSNRKTLILIAALVLGVVAAVVVRGYVSGVEEEAQGGTQLVPVLRLEGAVPRGTGVEEAAAAIAPTEIPSRFRPVGALTNLSDLSGPVAGADLPAGGIVVGGMFVDPAAAMETNAERVTDIDGEDQSAITISSDEVRGVAGLIGPGDYVNVLLVPPGDPMAAAPGAPGEESAPTTPTGARYLMQKVRVLYVDQTAVPSPGDGAAATEAGVEGEAAAEPDEPGNAGLLTLLVPPDSAQRLASVSPGSLYLTLVADDYEPVPMPPLDPAGPLPGEDPDRLTPYGPEGAEVQQ